MVSHAKISNCFCYYCMRTFVASVHADVGLDRGPAFGLPPVWASKLNPPRESIFESLERRAPGPLRYDTLEDVHANIPTC